MNVMPEFDDAPVEDDFYDFRDDEIERVDSNQAELTLPAGSSVDEVEMTKHDLDSDKETVPLPDGSSLESNTVEQDVIPVAVQEVEDPFVAPPEEIASFIFEDGGSTDVEEYVLCDEEDVLMYAERLSFNSMLPPFWLERVEVMLTQADESGTHADELLADCDMLLQELELEMGFQEDHFSALAVSMIVHADEMNVLSNELSVETNRHLGNLDIIFLEHERLAIQEDFQLVLEDCDRLDKVALGLRRRAAYLTEWVQYYQQLQDGEEKGDEVEFLPQEQEAAEVAEEADEVFAQEDEVAEEADEVFAQENEVAEEADEVFAQEDEVAEEADEVFAQEDEVAEEADEVFAQEDEVAEEADEVFAQEDEVAEEADEVFAQEDEVAEEAVPADLFLVAVPVEAEAAEGAGLADHFPEEAEAEHDMWGEEDPVVPQEDEAVIILGWFQDEVVDSWEDLWVE